MIEKHEQAITRELRGHLGKDLTTKSLVDSAQLQKPSTQFSILNSETRDTSKKTWETRWYAMLLCNKSKHSLKKSSISPVLYLGKVARRVKMTPPWRSKKMEWPMSKELVLCKEDIIHVYITSTICEVCCKSKSG